MAKVKPLTMEEITANVTADYTMASLEEVQRFLDAEKERADKLVEMHRKISDEMDICTARVKGIQQVISNRMPKPKVH